MAKVTLEMNRVGGGYAEVKFYHVYCYDENCYVSASWRCQSTDIEGNRRAVTYIGKNFDDANASKIAHELGHHYGVEVN